MDAQPVPDLTPSRGRAIAHTPGRLDTGALAALVARAADEHLHHVRFDVPWALAQPTPARLDGGIIESITSAVLDARAAGLAVWLRLLQPDVPRWLDNEGGLADDATMARRWPRWVDLVAEQFGDLTDGWVPIEAPFGLVVRLAPHDARRQGEMMERLVIAWRDAWRLLQGPHPVATSVDLAIERGSLDESRRRDRLRWDPWLAGLRDGVVRVPGRAERVLDDLLGACDQFGLALSADETTIDDLADILQRVGEQRLHRDLAVTVRAVGSSQAQRDESLERIDQRLAAIGAEAGLVRLTLLD